MKFLKYTLIFAFGILLVNCGDEKKEEAKETEFKIGSESVEVADDNVANITITGDDAMKFNKSELRVKAGQKVKLTLTHIGTMDVKLMGHNVVILKQGVDAATFAAEAALAVDNNYIPEGTTDVIAHTDMIGGKQSTTVEFTAPEAGTYDFICSFPAHFALMQGKFIVE